MKRIGSLLTLTAILALPLLLAVTLPALAGPAVVAAEDAGGGGDAGKQVFVAEKCTMCHSVEAAGVEWAGKSEKLKGPDLSKVGANHDAEWLAKYLKKEVAKEDGSEHKKGFSGEDADLEALAAWLVSLK